MGLFTVHNQGGSIFFEKHRSNMYTFVQLRGVSIFTYFSLKHKSAMYTFVQQRGGGVGPEGTQITKVCTNVHTCMYISHLAPPPPPIP